MSRHATKLTMIIHWDDHDGAYADPCKWAWEEILADNDFERLKIIDCFTRDPED